MAGVDSEEVSAFVTPVESTSQSGEAEYPHPHHKCDLSMQLLSGKPARSPALFPSGRREKQQRGGRKIGGFGRTLTHLIPSDFRPDPFSQNPALFLTPEVRNPMRCLLM
jgi:hypothetical protein